MQSGPRSTSESINQSYCKGKGDQNNENESNKK